jgi:hypothetical protein
MIRKTRSLFTISYTKSPPNISQGIKLWTPFQPLAFSITFTKANPILTQYHYALEISPAVSSSITTAKAAVSTSRIGDGRIDWIGDGRIDWVGDGRINRIGDGRINRIGNGGVNWVGDRGINRICRLA